MGAEAEDNTISAALDRAMAAGAEVRGTTSPNPPVGAVIVSAAGEVAGVAATQPVGGAHAEVMALRAAGEKARGGTAVVTLEPCAHTGRTGPCTQALIDAGVACVYYLHSDPTSQAAGGARALAEAGVDVIKLEKPPQVEDVLVPWLWAMRTRRPHITLKFAQSLDGFTAAADGTSQWITGESARDWVHADRARRDAIVVGTGTALADNPSLTARFRNGNLCEHQPRRVVIGKRDLKSAGDAASNLRKLGYEQYDSIDEALYELYASGARDVLVEGGAGLASSFLKADLVDAISAYIAPVLLGEGRGVLAHPVTQTLKEATRFQRVGMKPLGEDVLIEYVR